MSNGNYSCNRAVIFESAIILLLSLFWNNHISTTPTTTSPQQQLIKPLHNEDIALINHLHNDNHDISSPPSPQQTSPHLHLHKRRHLVTGSSVLNERHRRRQTRGFPVGAGADVFCNVRELRLISATSAFFAFHDESGSKTQKGRSQRGVKGERSKIKPHPRTR